MNGTYGLKPECLKADTGVWKISDQHAQSYVIKYMPFEEAQHHALNAQLYNMVGLPAVETFALPNKESISPHDGILIMPFLDGKVLSKHRKTMDADSRTDLYGLIKEETLAGSIIVNQTDPNDDNIVILNDESNALPFQFIDTEYGLASALSIDVKEQFHELTQNHKRFPHYTTQEYDHGYLLANAQDIVQNLQSLKRKTCPKALHTFIPEMIERGQTLIPLLKKTKF